MRVQLLASDTPYTSAEDPIYWMYASSELDKIQKLRTISPVVDTFFAEKQFLLKYDEDEYNDVTLLYEAYGIILEELHDIGIHIDSSVYLNDGYLADKMVDVYQFFRVDNLEKMFSYNDCICQLMYDYVTRLYPNLHTHPEYVSESNIAEDIVSLLETCKVPFEIDPNDLYYVILDTVNSCDATIMVNYIKMIVESLENKKLLESELPDTDLVTDYIAKIKRGREYFKTAIEKISKKYPIRTPLVELEIRKYDLTKIQPNVIKYYITLDKEEYEKNINLLSEQFRPYYEKYIINEHHHKEPHHYEYWEELSTKIGGIKDLDIIAMLVAHYYDPDRTISQTQQLIKPIYKVIDPEKHPVVQAMVQLMYS